MEQQKFKRGNLVHIAKDLGKAMSHFTNDVDAVIIGSYADQYGGNNTQSYTVIFLEDGRECSWYHESQLTLISKGGEHLINKAKENGEQIEKQDKDIKYILSKLDTGALSSTSILYLFELIGIKSQFSKNGEFFTLFSEWLAAHQCFVHIKNSKTLEEAKSIFTKTGLEKLNIERVFNAFHPD